MWTKERERERKRKYRAVRALFEPRRRWWRHDAVKQAFEIAYPAWLTAHEINVIVAQLLGRKECIMQVGRTVARFHAYGWVDRIGVSQWYSPWARKTNTGFRYRLRREARDLL